MACLERLPQDPWTQQDGTLLVSLAALMENGPLALALDPKLHSLFAQLWRHVRQASLWMRLVVSLRLLANAFHGGWDVCRHPCAGLEPCSNGQCVPCAPKL